MRLSRFFSEPLLHFFILGGLLFALYSWVNPNAANQPTNIVLTQGQQDSLESQFRRVWQRPPSATEMDGMIQNWLREEVMFREGIARGLDQDDPIVRRRIAQKMSFMTDGEVPEQPTDEQLQEWLDSHTADYQREAMYSLQQIYFDPALHRDALQDDLAKARAQLEQGQSENLGDSSMLPKSLTEADTSDVIRVFGSAFTAALADLPVNSWQGPITSGYGVHLVRLTHYQPSAKPQLEQVRTAVERDYLSDHAAQADERFYQALLKRYNLRIEPKPAEIKTP